MATDIEIAWVAGLLEGEGSFLTKSGGRYSAVVKCQMADKDVLDHLQRILDCGLIHACKTRNENHKPTWVWTVQGDQAVEVMASTLPFMFSRRTEQIEEALRVHLDRKKLVEDEKLKKILRNQLISQEYAEGELTYRDLGTKYGVSRETVRRIVNQPPIV